MELELVNLLDNAPAWGLLLLLLKYGNDLGQKMVDIWKEHLATRVKQVDKIIETADKLADSMEKIANQL